MSSTRIGIVHPGRMGASVGAAARAAGAAVAWAGEGRSEATHRRAAAAGLEDAGSLPALVERSDVLISVCPPAAAREVAAGVAELRFGGTYVDANAVAPATARAVADLVQGGGARYVDGGIVGLPPTRAGSTRLYLSGPGAREIAALFEGSLFGAVAIDGGPVAASALKVCYAAWTKGSAALLLSVRALAAAEGVEEPLLDEWASSQAGLTERSERVARANGPKGWRFSGEMREIAAAFAAAGLPDGFHEAAARVYERMAGFKDREPPPQLAEVVRTLLDGAE